MLAYLTLIFICQFAGEVLVSLVGLPVPGPVVGMVILLGVLMIMGRVPQPLGRIAETLLSHLSLLFVPAAVGVMLHFHLIGAEWPAMSLAVLASTIIGIVVTGLVMTLLVRRSHPRARED